MGRQKEGNLFLMEVVNLIIHVQIFWDMTPRSVAVGY